MITIIFPLEVADNLDSMCVCGVRGAKAYLLSYPIIIIPRKIIKYYT